jgi:hypothetical protein
VIGAATGVVGAVAGVVGSVAGVVAVNYARNTYNQSRAVPLSNVEAGGREIGSESASRSNGAVGGMTIPVLVRSIQRGRINLVRLSLHSFTQYRPRHGYLGTSYKGSSLRH